MSKTRAVIPFFIPNAGCPNICVFCDQKLSTAAVSIPDTKFIEERVRAWMSSMAPSVEMVEAAFYGGSFTALEGSLQEMLLSALLPFRESGVIQGIRLSTRPDRISREILERLNRFRVSVIELGAQSFNDRVLKLSGRGHKSAHTIEASKMIQDFGFDLVIQLMPGLPGDTEELSVDSAVQASLLKPSGARIYPTVVLKGTVLETMMLKGEYRPLTLEEAVTVTGEMVKIFSKAGVPVIRTGIHPLAPEMVHNIAAGPYHPALGFLVRSRLRLDEIRGALESLRERGPINGGVLLLPEARREEYTGYKRENLLFLEKALASTGTAIRFTNVEAVEYRASMPR